MIVFIYTGLLTSVTTRWRQKAAPVFPDRLRGNFTANKHSWSSFTQVKWCLRLCHAALMSVPDTRRPRGRSRHLPGRTRSLLSTFVFTSVRQTCSRRCFQAAQSWLFTPFLFIPSTLFLTRSFLFFSLWRSSTWIIHFDDRDCRHRPPGVSAYVFADWMSYIRNGFALFLNKNWKDWGGLHVWGQPSPQTHLVGQQRLDFSQLYILQLVHLPGRHWKLEKNTQ